MKLTSCGKRSANRMETTYRHRSAKVMPSSLLILHKCDLFPLGSICCDVVKSIKVRSASNLPHIRMRAVLMFFFLNLSFASLSSSCCVLLFGCGPPENECHLGIAGYQVSTSSVGQKLCSPSVITSYGFPTQRSGIKR